MVEQYIYSRSASAFINERGQAVPGGYGYMAYSPGMSAAMRQETQLYCEQFPHIDARTSSDCRLPLFRKVRLESGRMLFQKSTQIAGETSPFHVAHGYLADADDKNVLQPMNWFQPEYRLDDPNRTEGGILLDSLPRLEGGRPFPLSSLSETMKGLGLDRQHFFQMLLACFDAVSFRRQVLIAYDFSDPNARELQRMLLFWLFSCLPYALRRNMSFDSVYTEISSPEHIQFAFVDKNMITGSAELQIRAGDQSVPLRGNTLIVSNQIVRNSQYDTVWCKKEKEKTCFFSRWLESVTDLLWRCSDQAEELRILGALHQTYALLDAKLNQISAASRFSPECYSAVCWNLLPKMPLELASLGYARIAQMVEDESGAVDPNVGSILGASVAAEMDRSGSSITAVLEQYRARLPTRAVAQVLEQAFFGEVSPEGAGIWNHCQVSFSAEACTQRRERWYSETFHVCKHVSEIPYYILKQTTQFPGLSLWRCTKLAEDMAYFASRQLDILWPQSTIRDVIAFTRAAEPLFRLPARKPCCDMIDHLTRRCQADPGEAGLDILEELQEAFEPHREKAVLKACWHQLFVKQCVAIARRTPPFPDFVWRDPQFTGRIRALCSGLPDDFEKEHRFLDCLLREAYRRLLQSPPSFMDAAWLEQELGDRKPRNDTERALQLLAVFAQQPNKNLQKWQKDAERAQVKDTVWTQAAQAARGMFLAGTLPGVDAEFVHDCLWEQPEQGREILRQAARQGGGELLLGIIQKTADLEEQEMQLESESKLLSVVQMVSSDMDILDDANQGNQDGKMYFDETFRKLLLKLKKWRLLTSDETEDAIKKVNQHCRERCREKPVLNRIADVLWKR